MTHPLRSTGFGILVEPSSCDAAVHVLAASAAAICSHTLSCQGRRRSRPRMQCRNRALLHERDPGWPRRSELCGSSRCWPERSRSGRFHCGRAGAAPRSRTADKAIEQDGPTRVHLVEIRLVLRGRSSFELKDSASVDWHGPWWPIVANDKCNVLNLDGVIGGSSRNGRRSHQRMTCGKSWRRSWPQVLHGPSATEGHRGKREKTVKLPLGHPWATDGPPVGHELSGMPNE